MSSVLTVVKGIRDFSGWWDGICSRVPSHSRVMARICRRVGSATIILAFIIMYPPRVLREASGTYTFHLPYLPVAHYPKLRVFLMSSPTSAALQRLHHLDRSSPNFQDQLCDALYGEEYTQCVPNLQGDDLVWLVDYLDKVLPRVTFPHSAQASVGSRWSRSFRSRFP